MNVAFIMKVNEYRIFMYFFVLFLFISIIILQLS